MKRKKNKRSMYQKKCCEEKHVYLLLIGEEDIVLHRGRTHFCRYCLQDFRIAEKLNCHIKDCFKIDDKQRIKISKQGEYVRLKNYKRKIKPSFMIYADLESILVPEDNR